MATKFVSLERITEYDELIKAEIKAGDDSTLASAKNYADTKVSGLTSGTIVVKEAEHATSADETAHSASSDSATKATQDGNGKVIATTYETKSDASSKLSEAKAYADSVSAQVKNDLLNGAGEAYDTLKELGDLIVDNGDAIEALETVAAGKADAKHTHAISDVTNLQATLNAKATQESLDTHTANTTVHITATERTNWNAAKTHADSAHAPSNAEKNQNAFSNIKVGTTTVSADTATDTFELAGSNVTITPDATNDKITIAVATGSTSTAGILKLTNSTSSTSTTTAATPSSVKSAYDLANTAKTAAATAQTTADGKADAEHTHTVSEISDLTATAAELNYMDGVTSGVQSQIDGVETSLSTHTGNSDIHFTAAERTKLAGIATGATKVTVDSALSASSTNPVRNSVVTSNINILTSAVSANTSSISTNTSSISSLREIVDGIKEVSSEDIKALFA